jgi:hypothetical protein
MAWKVAQVVGEVKMEMTVKFSRRIPFEDFIQDFKLHYNLGEC